MYCKDKHRAIYATDPNYEYISKLITFYIIASTRKNDIVRWKMKSLNVDEVYEGMRSCNICQNRYCVMLANNDMVRHRQKCQILGGTRSRLIAQFYFKCTKKNHATYIATCKRNSASD